MWDDTLQVMMLFFPTVRFKLNSSDLTIKFPNGSEICLFGLDDKQRADRILGLEFSTILFEECSELDYASIMIALTRLAQKNDLKKKAYFTQNPTVKSHWSYKVFVQHEDPKDGHKLDAEMYSYLKMNTEDNLANIDPEYIKTLESLPINQRTRFLKGEFQDDVEGALFKQLWIERNRVNDLEDGPEKIIISLDPSGSSTKTSDECGIVVAGSKANEYYIIEDATAKLSPLQWAEKAVELYYKYEANYILAEINFGADMVKLCIKNVDKNIVVKECRASRGKLIRAEPISSLYENNYVHHIGIFPELELEMTSYLGEGKSPNRLDAMVWAVADLSDRSLIIEDSGLDFKTEDKELKKKKPGPFTVEQPVLEEDKRTAMELIESEELWTDI